jgi:TolA-binding protein
MSSRKSNKPVAADVKQFTDALVEDVVANVETLPEPEVIEQSLVVEEPPIEADSEQAEADRLNRVNDLEKQIIQHQESIKSLRSELKKLEGKTKREGPTKMELAIKLWKEQPGLQRKEYVKKFQDELGLTLAGARTYIQLIITKNK